MTIYNTVYNPKVCPLFNDMKSERQPTTRSAARKIFLKFIETASVKNSRKQNIEMFI